MPDDTPDETPGGTPEETTGRSAGNPEGDLYDVALVGFGPVGELLANLLGREGFRVVVFDREHDVYHLPRAAHFDGEIMRIFQSIGLAEAVLPATSLCTAYDFVNADGQTLLHFDGLDADDPTGWKADYFFYQPVLERALREGVTRYPNVEVHLGTEVVSVDAGPAGPTNAAGTAGTADDAGDEPVRLTVRPVDLDGAPAGGSEVVRARWVIGCDGGRSLVRKALDVTLEDNGFEEDWLVVDLVLTGDADEVRRQDDRLGHVASQICDPARPITQIPMPLPNRRWEFMLVDGETREEMERPETIARLVEPWLAPDQYEVLRAVVYTFHGLVARGWRRGRVLIAGDAAHQMPPFLGQGMCAGMRDAVNLGWKLAMVLRGQADPSVLDTYETERRPHVKTITDLAVTFGGIICTTDPAVAAGRDEAMLGGAAPAPPRDQRYPPLGPGLAPEGAAPVGPVGRQLPQPRVATTTGDEVLLDEVLGDGFALVVMGEESIELPAALAGWWEATGGRIVRVVTDPSFGSAAAAAGAAGAADPPGGILVTDKSGVLAEWFATHGATVALVRPDRYVHAVAAAGTSVLAQLEQLQAALRPVPST